MSTSGPLVLVTEPAPIELFQEHFVVRSWLSTHARRLDLEVHDYGPLGSLKVGPVVRSVTLPVDFTKDQNAGEFNFGTTGPRRESHVFLIGDATVNPSSVVINVRYDDGDDPRLYVWDWEADTLHVWTPPSPTKLIEGPVKVGSRLYFVVTDTSDAATLYSTSHSLSGESIHSAIAVSVPTERMMATSTRLAYLDNPGDENQLATGSAWNLASLGDAPTPVTIDNGAIGMEWNSTGSGAASVFAQPGQLNASDGTGFLAMQNPNQNRPTVVASITGAVITLNDRFSAWGGSVNAFWHFSRNAIAIRSGISGFSSSVSTRRDVLTGSTILQDPPNFVGTYENEGVESGARQFLARKGD